MICLGAFSSDSALATMKAFSPVSGLNGTLTICVLSSSSMSMPPWCVSVMVGARKWVLSVSEKYTSCSAGTPASKVTPLRLGDLVAVAVLAEVQALLLGERGLQVGGAADQTGLALLAHAALEHRLDEHLPVLGDQRLDLRLACVGAEDLRCRESRRA